MANMTTDNDSDGGTLCPVCGTIWYGRQCLQCKSDRDWERDQARKGRPIKIRYGRPIDTIPGEDDETAALNHLRARKRARALAREGDRERGRG